MAVKQRVAAILFLSWCVLLAIACDNDEVAIYEVKLKTMWSADRFPNFPNADGRKAQWSPVFGQSHNRSYVLYRVGEVARPAVQNLVHVGTIDDLMLQGEEEPKVYDQFSAPAIGSGVGETKGLVVVDGDHSLVSLISRMTPTAGWFVGVDSVDLCIDSSWVDQITLDLEPLSGGSPKEEYLDNDYSQDSSESAEIVSKLGSRSYFNNHAAGFLYKTSKELPTIAKAEFTKKEVYSTEEINKLVRNDVIAKLKQKNQHKTSLRSKPSYKTEENEEPFGELTTKNYVEHLKELEEEPFGTPVPNLPENNVVVVTKAPTFISSKEDSEEVDDEWMTMDDAVLAVANGRNLGLNKHLPRHFKSRLHHAVNHRPHRNYDATF